MSRVAIVLVGLTALTAHADTTTLGGCGPIARRHDHVQIRTYDLGKLRDTPTARVTVLAVRAGRTRPIPFQIDESRGRKPVLEGPGARIDQNPGVLDHDDVLVLMPCDAGARADDAERVRWTTELGATEWREITIHDPLTGRAGYVYVVVAPEPPRVGTRYVGYAESDLVATDAYRIGMAGALPIFFAMSIDDAMTPNLLDGLRLRADGNVKANLTSVSLTESDARHELVAWGDGPIRVVRRSEHHVHIGLGLEIGVGMAHTYFYPLRISGPGKMSLPFSPGVIFREITASGGVDLTGLEGWTFHGAGMIAPFAIDGTPNEAEASFTQVGHWFLLRRGSHALLTVMRLSPNLAEAVPLRLLYVDDGSTPNPPERLPGSVPLVGFQASDLQGLQAGKYEWVFEVLFEPDYRPDREQELLAQLATPLAVSLSARSDRVGARAARR
jgi:hypothetical protein